MSELESVLARIDSGQSASLERLFALLRIPSISTDPAYKNACQNAAKWCAGSLESMGFDASVRQTIGHPMVMAHLGGADGPHVLFYGHYDVQPVDPLSEWNTDPFQPQILEVDGERQILARGASDDKGQLMTFIEACRAWLDTTGGLPVNVTVLLEGEEECSSPSLDPFLDECGDELRADIALVCDTNMWTRSKPAIATMLRGLLYEEVTIKAADRDLHSGYYGSAAQNPIHVLARIIADLHDPNGRVTLPGFYDGVSVVSADQKMRWADLGFDEKAFLADVGLYFPAGESTYTVLEQIWSRPTAEVNGIIGGYSGEGAKTVIPATASTKISFRLVGEQDPDRIRDEFRSFVRERLPADCEVVFTAHGGEKAVQQPHNSPWVSACSQALEDEWGESTALIAMGGSIPIVSQFKRRFDMDTVLAGFANTDDRIHSPNEKYNLASFHKGTRSWARILAALAELK